VTEQSALLMAPIERVAPTLIAPRYKKVKKSADGFAQLSLQRRHKFRIAVKKLRYTIEVFKDLFDSQKVAEFVRLLKPLQDDLGYINDVRVANELLTDLQTSNADIARAAGIVLGWHDRGFADTNRKLRKHLRRFGEARPFW
jgi:CHAD domain-containing protein